MSVIRLLQSCWEWISEFVMSLFFYQVVNFDKTGLSVVVRDSNRSFVGEGAYSIVYKGTKRFDSSKVYAVKKMIVQSREYEKIVQTEIESFMMFQHPNILKLIDSSQQNVNGARITYLLFPYIKNGSLRDILNGISAGYISRQPISVILKNFCSICQSINILHTYRPSYVHQDIKPENILIDGDGRPLLTDFGSVRLADVNITNRNEALHLADLSAQYCTASYRAPELFDPQKGTRVDCRTDVWSLGCLLFAWWFGNSPFECEFHGTTFKVVECTALRVLAPIPRSSKPSFDDSIILELVEWILEKDFRNRPFTSDIIERIQDTINKLQHNRMHSMSTGSDV